MYLQEFGKIYFTCFKDIVLSGNFVSILKPEIDLLFLDDFVQFLSLIRLIGINTFLNSDLFRSVFLSDFHLWGRAYPDDLNLQV